MLVRGSSAIPVMTGTVLVMTEATCPGRPRGPWQDPRLQPHEPRVTKMAQTSLGPMPPTVESRRFESA